MDELVDILDEKGNHTGEIALKSKAHQLGLFHPTIHVWCYSKSGSVLLQQRGASKSAYPLKWDVSVAGHIGAGELPTVGAVREVQEEIGVTIDASKLEYVGVFKIEKRHQKNFWDREFNHTYLYLLDVNTPLQMEIEEVEALEWVSLYDFEDMVTNEDARFVPNSSKRYLDVIRAIQSRL